MRSASQPAMNCVGSARMVYMSTMVPAPLRDMPMSVSFGARWSASVTMDTLEDMWTTVRIQKARVLNACIAVNSCSSSASAAPCSALRSDACLAPGLSPSGLRPMSSGLSRSRVNTGRINPARKTDMPNVVQRNPYSSMPSAKTGTSSPPRCMPDMEVAMASERCRTNQLFISDIRASQPPTPDPRLIVMNEM